MSFEWKREARARYRSLRESLGEHERSAIDGRIAEQVLSLPEYAAADVVYAYLSVGAEVDTRRVIRASWDAGKTVVVPRCVLGSNLMTWHRICSFDNLERGPFGIEEPPDDASTLLDARSSEAGDFPIALVPAYSFDAQGFRLGYGGGFYDAFLADFPGVSIGLCRACQQSEQPLPREAHDFPVRIVACESHVLRVACGSECFASFKKA